MSPPKGVGRKAATVASLLDDANARLSAALGLEKREARLEARVLAGFAWNVTPAWLIAHDSDTPTEAQIAQFTTLLARRLSGEPIAYLTGTREFYGREFRVTPDVLIPRPETELLIELALARIPPDLAIEVLELGTGSGCIAVTLALERPKARITAVDRMEAALAIARDNARRLDATVEFLYSHWFAALAGRRFDLIVGNPPYIASGDTHLQQGDLRHEPPSALASGAEGLDDLLHIVEEAPAHLGPEGCLLLEHGYNQAETLRKRLEAAGLKRVQSWHDLAGIARVSGGCMSE